MRLYNVCGCEFGTTYCPEHPIHYAFKHKNKLHRGTTHTANSVLARRYADKVRQEVIADGIGLPVTWNAPGLKQHIDDYVEHQKGAFPRTATRDARVLSTFLAAVGDKRLSQVSTFDLERWRSVRQKVGNQRSTIERDEHTIRGCLTYATKRYAKQKFANPFTTLAAWKPNQTKRRALSKEELRTALQGLPPRLALICRVTVECLPRLSEVLDLQKSDLGPTWIGFRRKGGQVTKVQATPALIKDLRAQLLTDDQQWVFGNPSAEERQDLVAWLLAAQARTSVAFTRAFRAIGFTDVSHHVMRHTGVTFMLERGENPRVIQELAGWSTLRMLEHYGHISNEAQRRAVAGNADIVTELLQAKPGKQGGVPSGSRTRVSGVKGRRPGPLDDGDNGMGRMLRSCRGSQKGSHASERVS